jgi:hypothetical protein
MEYKLLPFDLPLRVSRIANVHYFEFTRQYHTFDDAHNFCELLYVDRGSISVHAENYSGILSDNQLLIHRPNEKHFLECSESGSPNVVIIGFECGAPELARFSTGPITLQPVHKNMLSRILTEGMAVYEPPYDIPNTLEMKKREAFPFGADQMLKINLEAFFISLVRTFGIRESGKETEPLSEGKIAEIYNYITAYDSLEYTYEGDKVYNPSATDVWLRTPQGETFKIPSGETVILKK